MAAHDDLDFNIPINNEDGIQGISSKMKNPIKEKEQPKKEAQLKQENINLLDTETSSTGKTDAPKNNFSIFNAAHPFACFFTFFFKVLAILSYWFLDKIVGDKIITFIFIVLFSAFDFWTVKNITGRILVGLRWWNDFKEDGTEVWIFEGHDANKIINPIDSKFFWGSQILASVFWILMLFSQLISLSAFWVLVVGTALVLNLVNLNNFYKCRGDHQNKIKNLTESGIQSIGTQLMQRAFAQKK